MNELFLLVVLTSNAAGDISASFVNTPTRAACELRREAVAGIFTSARVTTLQSRCMRSALRFTPFGHAVSSAMPRRFYLVDLAAEVAVIEPLPDWQSCLARQRVEPSPARYCASSIQQPLNE